MTITMLGLARRVTATKDNTTIVEGKGSQDATGVRMKQIRAQIEDTTSYVAREKLRERLAKLTGGVAIIKVDALTEVELKEKKHRIEDALSAMRAAVEEGIVAAGGTALVNALPALDKLQLQGDERIGVEILRRALEEPLRQIAFNAGAEGSVVVARVKGFDARIGEYVDMFKAGIIDPTKVTCHGRLWSGCGIIAVNMSRCVTKSAKPHAPWRPAAASRSATAVGARRGKTGNKGRRTRGLQYRGHRTPALSGTHQGGRTVPRLGTVGPSWAALSDPCGAGAPRAATQASVGSARPLAAAAAREVRAVPVRGVCVASPTGRRPLPVA